MKPELGNSIYQINKEGILHIVFPDATNTLVNIELHGNALVIYYNAPDVDTFILDGDPIEQTYDLDAYKIKFPYKDVSPIKRVEFKKVAEVSDEVSNVDTRQLNQYIDGKLSEERLTETEERLKNNNRLKWKIQQHQTYDQLLKENHLYLNKEAYEYEKEKLLPLFDKIEKPYFTERAVDQLEVILRKENIIFYNNYALERESSKLTLKALVSRSERMVRPNQKYKSLPTLGEGVWRYLDSDWEKACDSFKKTNLIAAFFLLVCSQKIELSVTGKDDDNKFAKAINKIPLDLKEKYFHKSEVELVSLLVNQFNHYFSYQKSLKDYLEIDEINAESTFRTQPTLIPWSHIPNLITIEKGILHFLSKDMEKAEQAFIDVYDISNCYLALSYINQKRSDKAKPILNRLQESKTYGKIANAILVELDNNNIQLNQYINGELSGETLKAFEKKIEDDKELRLKIEQHQANDKLLQETHLRLNEDVYKNEKEKLKPLFDKIGKQYFKKKITDQSENEANEIQTNQYINGELSGNASKQFEEILKGDEELRLKVEQHQAYDQLLKENYLSFEKDRYKKEKERFDPLFDKLGKLYFESETTKQSKFNPNASSKSGRGGASYSSAQRVSLPFQLLKTFTEKELDSFERLLDSNYINNETDLSFFLKILRKDALHSKNFTLEIQNTIYKAIYKNENTGDLSTNFHRKKLSQIMNELLRAAEKFLMYESINRNEAHNAVLLFPELIERSQLLLYNKRIKSTEKKLSKVKKHGVEYHNQSYNIQKEKAELLFKYKALGKEDNYDLLQYHTDVKYLLEKLQNHLSKITLQKVYQHKSFDFSSYQACEALLKLPQYQQNPLIKLYLLNIDLIDIADDNTYNLLFSTLQQYREAIPDSILKTFYNNLNNYSSIQIAKGNFEFYKNLLTTYKAMYNDNLLLNKNTNDIATLKNVVVVACRSKDFDWANNILEENIDFVNNDIRESVLNYNKGIIAFNKKDYHSAHDYFIKVGTIDELHSIDLRIALLQCYYQMDAKYENQTMQIIYSLRTFLSRSNKMTKETNMSYLNYMRIFSNLYKLKKIKNIDYSQIKNKENELKKSFEVIQVISFKNKFKILQMNVERKPNANLSLLPSKQNRRKV